MEGHVVRCAIVVRVCDVMGGADGHDSLTDSVHDGEIHYGPVETESGGGRNRKRWRE